ncbi:InlB B-repeat-containing protein, partial [Mesotoga sp. UBA5557]|uniref:InlB B-repeat-containing protein n=1 Tax=Mesotoga sp. UBA5557 TaxID=1946857 RepID=UPI0025EC604C
MKKTSSVLLSILLVLVVFSTQGCFLFRNVTLSIENSELSIGIGESEQIRIKVKPEDATLKFSSNNESVATVTTSGMVIGVSAGEAEITIEATKDKYKSALKKVSVQVVGEESFSVTFSVIDSSGAVQGANVTFNSETKTTDASGKAVFAGVLAGNKDYFVNKAGYNEAIGSVNVDEDKTVEVTLERKAYIITATAGPGGSIDPSGEVEVDHGDSINFSVIADDGYAIEDVVSDGVSIGQVDNYTYTKVTSDHTIHATFKLKTYTLTTNVVGQGTVTKNPNKTAYDYGEEVQLTATPDEGWNFAGWSGDLSGSANPANIAMDSNKTVTATFTIKKYTIAASANPPAGGAITGAGSYNHGDAVNLVATANEGYEFINWTENGVQVSANAAYSFTATSNRTLVANFRLKTYTITATAVAGGNINPAGNVNVTHGSSQSFTIIPNASYDIGDVEVDGVSVGAVSSYTFNNVTANHTIHATFRLKTYTIAVSANPPAGGTVTGAVSYNHGDTVDLVATPNEGYEFVNWTENGEQVSTNAAYSFVATANRTLVANFRLKTYTITATDGAGGNIDPSGDVSVNHGDDQEFAITPDEGYNVEDVLIDGESVGPRTSYTFTEVAADHTIHASFSLLPPPTYTVTFNVSDNQGAVQGASVTFYGETKATDAQGKAVFTGVLAGNRAYTVSKIGYNNATGNVNVDGDETVGVILTKKTYTITATAGAGGSINPAGNVQVEHGSNRLFNITPNTGYEIEDVKVDGVSIGAVSTYNFKNVTTNHTIHATFRLKSYTITVSANPPAGGNVSGGGNYTHGDTVNLLATPNEGYEFVNWTENGVQVSANAAYSFTATANRTLVANFRLKTYTITATAGAGGNINPAGNVQVEHGS